MCFGGGSVPHDNSAELARAEEAARQARIKTGQEAIDNSFGAFDDNFYNKISTDYKNYYNPQLDSQYTDAMKNLTLKLASSGNLTSSYGADAMAKLRQKYAEQQGYVADQALAAANNLRTSVASTKNQLYSQNQTAADPSLASEQAIAATANLQAPQTFSPLGDLFSSFLSNVGTNAGLASAGYTNYMSPLVKSASGSGSQKIVS